MDIDRVDVTAYRVPLEKPEADGTLTWDHTTVVVVEPHDGGIIGLGYAYASSAAAHFVHDVLTPVILGRDTLDVSGAWNAMVKAIRNHGRPGVTSCRNCRGRPRTVGPKGAPAPATAVPASRNGSNEVPIYGSGGFTSLTPHELTAQLGAWVHDDGLPCVKMKIGTAWAAISPPTCSASSSRGGQSARTPSSSSTPTAPIPVSKRSGSTNGCATSTSPRSKNPSHRRSRRPRRDPRPRQVTSRPANTATTSLISSTCVPRMRSTACRPT